MKNSRWSDEVKRETELLSVNVFIALKFSINDQRSIPTSNVARIYASAAFT